MDFIRLHHLAVFLASVSLFFQIIGFSSKGWIVVSTKWDASSSLGLGEQQQENRLSGTQPPNDNGNVPTGDGGVPFTGNNKTPIDNGGVPHPGNTVTPIDNGGVPHPDNIKTPIDNGGVPHPDKNKTPIDNGGVPHPDNNKTPIDNGGVPRPDNSKTQIDNGKVPSPSNNRRPIDNGGVPHPDKNKTPIDNGGVPHPDNNKTPIDNGGVPRPDNSKTPIDNSGVPHPGNKKTPIDNGGVPRPDNSKTPIDKSGVPHPDNNKTQIDNGGVPRPDNSKTPNDNGGVPHPGNKKTPIDNGGVPRPDNSKTPIDNSGVPRPDNNKTQIDNGEVPNPSNNRRPIDNGGVRIPGNNKTPIDMGGVPHPDINRRPKNNGADHIPNINDDHTLINENGRTPFDQTNKVKPNNNKIPIDNGGVPTQDDIRTPFDHGGRLVPVKNHKYVMSNSKNSMANMDDSEDDQFHNDMDGIPVPESEEKKENLVPVTHASMTGRRNLLQVNDANLVRDKANIPSMATIRPAKLLRPLRPNKLKEKIELPTTVNPTEKIPLPPMFPQREPRDMIKPTGKPPMRGTLEPRTLRILRPLDDLVGKTEEPIQLWEPINNKEPTKTPIRLRGPINEKESTKAPIRLRGPINNKEHTKAPTTDIKWKLQPRGPINDKDTEKETNGQSTTTVSKNIGNKPTIPTSFRRNQTNLKNKTVNAIAKRVHFKKTNSNLRISVGLWTATTCSDGSGCNDVSIQDAFLSLYGLSRKFLTLDMKSWNDLRIETIFGLICGIVGFVGTLLSVKPFCLNDRRRITLMVGMIGMAMSCILFLVPISRVANYHSLMDDLEEEFKGFIDDYMIRRTPWACIIAGIGAGLALVTSGLLLLVTWCDQKQKWHSFKNDNEVVFTKEADDKEPTARTNEISNESIYATAYDNGTASVNGFDNGVNGFDNTGYNAKTEC